MPPNLPWQLSEASPPPASAGSSRCCAVPFKSLILQRAERGEECRDFWAGQDLVAQLEVFWAGVYLDTKKKDSSYPAKEGDTVGRGFAVPGGIVSSSLVIVPACLRYRSQGTQGVDVLLHPWRLFGCPSSRRSQAGQQPRCSPDKLAGAGGEVLTV